MPQIDDNAPRPRPEPERYVRRITAGEKIGFCCLSPHWWSVWIHWDGRRSSPHMKVRGDCEGCKRGTPKRWKAYLHVINLNNNADEFLELTPASAEQLERGIGQDGNMRGWRFSMERGKGDKARLTVNVLAHISRFPEAGKLKEAQDPKSTLMQLWGLTQGSLGDDNEDIGVVA